MNSEQKRTDTVQSYSDLPDFQSTDRENAYNSTVRNFLQRWDMQIAWTLVQILRRQNELSYHRSRLQAALSFRR